MGKKNILILVRTEYQLLLGAQLILTEFSDSHIYNITIIRFSRKGTKRRRPKINYDALPVKWIEIEADISKSANNEKMRQIIKELLTVNYYKFIHFMEHAPLGYYFSDVLFRRGTIISLGQDGTKAYTEYNRNDLFYRIKHTLLIYKFLISNKLFLKNFYFFNSKYGSLKQTNELLLTHPEAYHNWNKKKLLKIHFNNELDSIDKLKVLFEYEKNYIRLKDRSIFFVNQPIADLYFYEIDVLKKLREKYEESTIYIKVHSQTPQNQLKLYGEISSCVIINTSIPAELYIATLNDSIIISFYSTALLFYNKRCSYFWLHEPILEEKMKSDKILVTNPTEHIKVIKSFDSINFK